MKRPLDPAAFLHAETYARTRLPVDFASTLIPDAYTAPEFYALEQERVFAKSWVPVCVVDEVRAYVSACKNAAGSSGRFIENCLRAAGTYQAIAAQFVVQESYRDLAEEKIVKQTGTRFAPLELLTIHWQPHSLLPADLSSR